MSDEICKTCGHSKKGHNRLDGSCSEGQCYANFSCCKKFEPQNQSPTEELTPRGEDGKRLSTGSQVRKHQPHSDTRKGIFDTSDLEKEIDDIREDFTDNDFEEMEMMNNEDESKIALFELEAKKKERKRLRAEVEKIIDELSISDKKDSWIIVKELKKRLLG